MKFRYSGVTINENFETFLMFRPNIANAQWVSMAKATWSWSGIADRGHLSGWTLRSGTASNPNADITSGIVGAIPHPQWDKNNLPNFVQVQ